MPEHQNNVPTPEERAEAKEMLDEFEGRSPSKDLLREVQDADAMNRELDRVGEAMRTGDSADIRNLKQEHNILLDAAGGIGLMREKYPDEVTDDMTLGQFLDVTHDKMEEIKERVRQAHREDLASLQGLPEKASKGVELRPVEQMTMDELKRQFGQIHKMRMAVESLGDEPGYGMTRNEFFDFADARMVKIQKEFRKRMSDVYPGISPEGM